MNDFFKKCSKLAMYCFLAFIGIIIACGSITNGIILSIISIVILYLFVEKIEIKKFGLFIFVISLIIKIISIIFLKIPIKADYELMYNASLDVLKGDFSFANNYYFGTFGYQLGNVFYQALVLKIINSANALRVLNCIYSSVITLIIYLLIKRFSKEKTARFISLFYTISLYPTYLNSVLGNQQLSLMLIMIGVYIFLTKEKKISNLILIGFFIALGNLERTEGIIYIACIIVYSLLYEKINIKTIKSISIILFVYFLINISVSNIVLKSGINEIGLKNNNPNWKLLTGLNVEDSGKYSSSDQDKYISDSNLEKEIIKQRLTDYKNLPKLFYRKINVQWQYSDLTETFNAKNNKQFSQFIINTLAGYTRCMNYFILLAVLIGQCKNKMTNIEKFFMLNICAYFIIYLFIEVNARYYFNPQTSIMILSAAGIETTIKYLNKIHKKDKIK